MQWLLRPWTFTFLGTLLVLGAGAVIYQTRPGRLAPGPLPLEDGAEEVVWLYPATNTTGWNRFVTAVQLAARRQQPGSGLEVEITGSTFLEQSTAVPEVALRRKDGSRSLVFRWYKLTSDRPTSYWVRALVQQRERPPLAIIGGNTSDVAQDLACQLARHTADLDPARRPLLLITTATADRVPRSNGEDAGDAGGEEAARAGLAHPGDDVALTGIYPGRTFRFCFTNSQMADAVTQLIWTQDDLRPMSDPIYEVKWEDDTYSRDLVIAFRSSLTGLAARLSAQEWAWVSSAAAGSGSPLSVVGPGIFPWFRARSSASSFRMRTPPVTQLVDSSVGTFALPNRFEARVARYLLLDLDRSPPQAQSLLVVTGQAQTLRRFLRSVARSAPLHAPRLVVATGDAISFNTIYRDRHVTWPVQDLPFPLVFFCHQNPVDPQAGFRPCEGDHFRAHAADGAAEDPGVPPGVGTEDILLYSDIVGALTLTALRAEEAAPGAGAVADRLRQVRHDPEGITLAPDGLLLFDRWGNRNSGTGEHLVCVRPKVSEGRILPEAGIEVWRWRPVAAHPDGEGGGGQQRIASLTIRYD